MVRILSALISIVVLSACNGASDLDKPAVPLGDFNLYHNIVVAPKVQKLPISREVSEEVLTTAVKDAIAERFDRYEGARNYHFGVSVEGYVLAPPGIPLVLAPKSIMILNLTVWDDAAGKKLTEEPHQITVFESLDQGPIVGSGYTKTAEEQLKNLSQNAAKSIENYLVKQNKAEGWFERPADAVIERAEIPSAPAVTAN
ncbi:hypothetical protein [uncultured Sulfitobacter sp.]|jgi:hypothetical protein|uniref:hypothetical protein n=1 Tax=uncultured Sulfitobacter sp. TaxID=191468 RepID=UPI002599AB58|nr:hypothetical protein [uncultured Sulfitobacter sp.]|tara:strand:+ start:1494 stop:2093 length:600 start_codon:yes stop_codon:yes gene_type:complete